MLLDGLRRLEYRGYDSAGLAVHDGKDLNVVRAVGKLQNLKSALDQTPLKGATGIGHTRWATHGRPSEVNAHPHVAGTIALVHNGIIENHVALRHQILERGEKVQSDTDTEIVAHLINLKTREGHGLEEAVRLALREVRGTYAIAVVSKNEPDKLVVSKTASPLVLGLGQGEMFVGSDVPALLPYTRDMIFLEDGEIATLTANSVRISTLDGKPVERAAQRIDWSEMMAEKAGFKHFMLKEIHEQSQALQDTFGGRVDFEAGRIDFDTFALAPEQARRLTRLHLLACGTSWHAALVGK